MKQIRIVAYLCMVLILQMSSCGLEDLIKEVNPPEVSTIYSTAENFSVNPGDTILFWVIASDPEGGSLSYLWTLNAGEIIGSAQRDTLKWKAPLSGGEFPIWVKVSKSEKSITREENITVISLQRPYVKILKPVRDTFLVQYQTTTVTALAFHENGLMQVNLWVNDTLVSSQSGNSASEYNFLWNGSASAGTAEIKISAVSKKTTMTGSDSINVSLEGIIRGKKKATH